MHHLTKNTHYSGLSMLNHWLTVLAVTAMWTLGIASLQGPELAEDYIIGIHIGLGFFVLWFVLWRIAWRLYKGFPEPQANGHWTKLAAAVMHRLLLTVLVILVLTGPMYLFTEQEGMDVFGWFTFYIPMPTGEIIHESIEWVHMFCAKYLFPILIGLHILAAAWHWLSPTEALRD